MTKIDDTLGYMICRTARKVHRHMEKIFSPYGLTLEQWVALKVISENPGCSQKELAALLDKDQNTVKAMVDRLLQKEYVQRTVNPNDRRAFILEITPLGEKTIIELSAQDEQENRILETGLGPEQTAQLRTLLQAAEKLVQE